MFSDSEQECRSRLRSDCDDENPMRETHWVEWTRTRLRPRESEELVKALTLEQKAHLLEHDYVWVEGIGVLWRPVGGVLRRAWFTRGTHFRTPRGEFYIDSDGSVRDTGN
jgi:hypothetical protein